MNILTLAVNKKYFEQIKSGIKKEEYRLLKKHWITRIVNKPSNFYDFIVIQLGYPPKGTKEKQLFFFWRGYEIKKITHEHFGENEVEVIAIKLERIGD